MFKYLFASLFFSSCLFADIPSDHFDARQFLESLEDVYAKAYVIQDKYYQRLIENPKDNTALNLYFYYMGVCDVTENIIRKLAILDL